MSEKTTEKEVLTAEQIWKEYEKGRNYKASLGKEGLYEQTKKNERFMLGDQWNGADTGDIPKVVMNVIKQIGDFKVSNIISNPCTAIYEFDGVPTAIEAQRTPNASELSQVLSSIEKPDAQVSFEAEHQAVATALTAHFCSVWERCKMNKLNQRGVRKSYISGSYVLYSYFDPELKTGLWASSEKNEPIKGDIAVELLDISNVYFGNPTICEVQQQPSIIISQRKALKTIKREMVKNFGPEADVESVTADDKNDDVGNYNEGFDEDNKYTTLLTRFWKDENGDVKAIQCTSKAIVKDEWDIGLTQYPISLYNWDETDSCIYGHSEITELIPNQIAINRMISLEILSEMQMGLPKIVYNEDAISQEITNDPGQIIAVTSQTDVRNAIQFLNPAQMSPNWHRVQQELIDNTKSVAGATAVALGDVRPENTSAIVALREAANMPLQPYLNRYYDFIEDNARIWGEMIIRKYGKRSLRVETDGRVTYVPFDGDRYKDMMLSARIEVGPSTLWATSTVIATLDNLLKMKEITIIQFLERIPEGIIPKKQQLINQIKAAQEAAQAQPKPPQGADIQQLLSTLSDEQLAAVQENPALLEQFVANMQQ
ncbi:MAG: hypothetical protein IKK09_01650 [Clostridia bacterium]|nr:hypothetical protein [Clostridia bacterium]